MTSNFVSPDSYKELAYLLLRVEYVVENIGSPVKVAEIESIRLKLDSISEMLKNLIYN
jgi:hypothetical protein